MSVEAADVEKDRWRELLRKHDGFALVREMLRYAGHRDGEYAGIPMPLADETLVVEPKYPMSKELCDIVGAKLREHDEPEEKPRNVFWSHRYKCDIVVWNGDDRKVEWGVHPGNKSFNLALHTLGCSDAWGVEQEAAAVQLLAEHVTHRQMKHYLLTGMFLEKSKRSGVTYVFRRLRPTVAMAPSADGSDMRILCTLCLHPIAYYAGTHAGAMCPTDDVVAHLLLMRGDERRYWSRANQHPAIRPESGVS